MVVPILFQGSLKLREKNQEDSIVFLLDLRILWL